MLMACYVNFVSVSLCFKLTTIIMRTVASFGGMGRGDLGFRLKLLKKAELRSKRPEPFDSGQDQSSWCRCVFCCCSRMPEAYLAHSSGDPKI